MEAVMSKTLCKGEPAGTNLVGVGLRCQFYPVVLSNAIHAYR